MGIVGRLIGIVVALFVAAAAAGAIAARGARERLVRREDPEADEVALVAIFAPLQFRSRAGAFRGGTVDCWYGGGTIDLRGATLDSAGATLRVRAIFGGGQVVVPDDWRVETRVTGIGGIGDTRRAVERPVTAPLLRVEGLVVFGGFGVSSTLPDDAASWMAQGDAAGAGASETADVAAGEVPATV